MAFAWALPSLVKGGSAHPGAFTDQRQVCLSLFGLADLVGPGSFFCLKFDGFVPRTRRGALGIVCQPDRGDSSSMFENSQAGKRQISSGNTRDL